MTVEIFMLYLHLSATYHGGKLDTPKGVSEMRFRGMLKWRAARALNQDWIKDEQTLYTRRI